MSRTAHRLHVLTLIDALPDGGAERLAVDLLAHCDPGRFRRSICLTRGGSSGLRAGAGRNIACLRAAGVEVLAIERRSRLDGRGWVRLVRHLRQQQVDIIHAHKFGSNFWAAVLGRVAGVPVVIAHEHTWSFEGQHLRRFVDRRVIAPAVDAVIAVSEADRRRMIELVRIPADRVVVIPNGIPSWPGGDGAAVRRELGLGPEAPVLVQTAVLRAQKAIEVMLEALSILRRSVPEARLLVIGQGDATGLLDLAARLGVAEAVSFLGHRDDVPALLAAADVGVLSSDFEGSPLAVLEYMAAGLPVVATAVGGVPAMVEHGRTGLLVPRRDPVALASSIARLLSDPGLARRMGESGRARQRAEYSSEVTRERVYELYERLWARSGRGRRSATEPAA